MGEVHRVCSFVRAQRTARRVKWKWLSSATYREWVGMGRDRGKDGRE